MQHYDWFQFHEIEKIGSHLRTKTFEQQQMMWRLRIVIEIISHDEQNKTEIDNLQVDIQCKKIGVCEIKALHQLDSIFQRKPNGQMSSI